MSPATHHISIMDPQKSDNGEFQQFQFWGIEDERRAKMSPATHHMSIMDPQRSDNGEFQ